jgi:hypothetical protein
LKLSDVITVDGQILTVWRQFIESQILRVRSSDACEKNHQNAGGESKL